MNVKKCVDCGGDGYHLVVNFDGYDHEKCESCGGWGHHSISLKTVAKLRVLGYNTKRAIKNVIMSRIKKNYVPY